MRTSFKKFLVLTVLFIFVLPVFAANVAKIGDVEYETLADAVAACKVVTSRSALAKPENNTVITLLSDVEITAPVEIGYRSIRIDGNGYTIKRGESFPSDNPAYSMFWLGKQLNKYNGWTADGAATESLLYFKNVIIEGKVLDGEQNVVTTGFVVAGTTTCNLVLENGAVIQNNTTSNAGSAYCCLGGSASGFTMEDGAIIRNCTTTANGGAVNMDNGVTTVRGGLIENCTANKGGAFFIKSGSASSMTVTGGIIRGCKATGTGGAIFSQVSITLSGGLIENCSSDKYGGGIGCDKDNVSGMVLTGDLEIKNCTAQTSGGGVFFNFGITKKPVVELSGNLKITGCTAKTAGGGVFMGSDGLKSSSSAYAPEINIKDNVVITGNTLTGGKQGAGVWFTNVYMHPALSGKACVYGNTDNDGGQNNLAFNSNSSGTTYATPSFASEFYGFAGCSYYNASTKALQDLTSFTGTATSGTNAVFRGHVAADYYDATHSALLDYSSKKFSVLVDLFSEGSYSVCKPDGTEVYVCDSLAQASALADEENNLIKLNKNVKEETTLVVAPKADIVFDANGYTMDVARKYAKTTERPFTILKGDTSKKTCLTLKNGTIDGGNVVQDAFNAPFIYVDKGYCKLVCTGNLVIQNFAVTDKYGIVGIANESEEVLFDGVAINNCSSDKGDGFFFFATTKPDNPGLATFRNTVATNCRCTNTSDAYGGGFLSSNGDAVGILNIEDGTIIQNCYALTGAAFMFQSTSGAFVANFKGGEIRNNTGKRGAAIAIINNDTNAVVNLSGTKIYGNSVTGNGCAVYVERGTFNMTGGEIYENYSAPSSAMGLGAGIYCKGSTAKVVSVNLTGGSIHDNVLTDEKETGEGGRDIRGAGVCAENHVNITIGGTVEIYNNINKGGSAAGVYVNGANLKICDSAKIYGNLYGKGVKNGTKSTGGVLVFNNTDGTNATSVSLSGSPVIKDNGYSANYADIVKADDYQNLVVQISTNTFDFPILFEDDFNGEVDFFFWDRNEDPATLPAEAMRGRSFASITEGKNVDFSKVTCRTQPMKAYEKDGMAWWIGDNAVISLEDNIPLSIALEIPADKNPAELKAVVAVPKYIYEGGVYKTGVDYIELNTLADRIDPDSGQALFSADLSPMLLASSMSVEIKDENGQTVANKSYSGRDYCESVLSSKTAPENLKNLCKSLLNYGAAVQEYFGFNTGDLANKSLKSEEKVLPADEIIAAITETVLADDEETLKFIGCSLVLDGNITMRFYFNYTGEGVLELDDEYNNIIIEPVSAGSKEYVVKVSDIAAAELSVPVSFTVQNEDASVSYSIVDYAPVSWVKRACAVGADNVKPLAKAIYAYSQAADTYFTN